MMMKSLVKTHQFNNEGTNEDTRRDGIMEGQVWSGIRVKTMYKSKKNIFSLYNKKHLKKLEKCTNKEKEASIPGSQIEGLTLRQIERQTTNKYTDTYLYCEAGKKSDRVEIMGH